MKKQCHNNFVRFNPMQYTIYHRYFGVLDLGRLVKMHAWQKWCMTALVRFRHNLVKILARLSSQSCPTLLRCSESLEILPKSVENMGS